MQGQYDASMARNRTGAKNHTGPMAGYEWGINGVPGKLKSDSITAVGGAVAELGQKQ